MIRRCRTCAVLLALLVVSAIRANAQAIQYVCDDVGRLIGVVDPSGDTATYTYDAVGNLLSISRHASSTVSIISFAPGRGSLLSIVTDATRCLTLTTARAHSVPRGVASSF